MDYLLEEKARLEKNLQTCDDSQINAVYTRLMAINSEIFNRSNPS